MATGNEAIGKVVQVAGPAVDCEFAEGHIPPIHTAIRITSEGFQVPEPIDIICEAEQHIGEGRVRTIALQPTEGLRSEEHTSELQSLTNLVCRLLLEKKKKHQPHTLHR